MTREPAVDNITVYSKDGALEELEGIIKAYVNIHGSNRQAGIALGFGGRRKLKAGNSLTKWVRGSQPIPLKHLIPICHETNYSIKSFLEKDDVIIKYSLRTTDIPPYDKVINLLETQ